jgi:transcriptional regulator with XRE-family HTH domain
MNNAQRGITAPELKTTREHLGLSDARLAAHLGTSSRTVRNWEEGKYPIPDGVTGQIAALEESTDAFIAEQIKTIANEAAPTFETYRSDAECPASVPYGAAWHRAAAARIARAVPGCALTYAPDEPRLPDLDDTAWLQLADVLQGTYIDDAVRQDPRAFLTGEIEDCLDDLTDKCAYPELLAEARLWTRGQATAVLAAYDRKR